MERKFRKIVGSDMSTEVRRDGQPIFDKRPQDWVIYPAQFTSDLSNEGRAGLKAVPIVKAKKE